MGKINIDKITLKTIKSLVLLAGYVLLLSSCTLSASLESLNPVVSETKPIESVDESVPAEINKIGSMIAIQQDSANITLDNLFVDKTTNIGEKVSVITIVSEPLNGSLTGQGLNYYYTPNPGFLGEDVMSYEAVSEKGNKITGDVKFKIARKYTWYGAGTDNKWSNPVNWVGGVPTNSDIVYFDDTCTKCEVFVDGINAVSGVLIDANFTGVINFSNDELIASQITVGSSGFIFKNGTINLGKGKITSASNVSLEAGTFNGNSGNFVASKNFTIVNTVAFNAENSLFEFNGNTGGSISVGTAAFGNVSFKHDSSSKTLVGTLSVYGSLLFNVTFVSVSGGQIDAYGDVTLTKMTSSGSAMNLRLVGNNNQLITGAAIGVVPNFEVAKTGGTAFVSGVLAVSKNFKYTSGVIDFYNSGFGTATTIFTGANTGGTITVPNSLLFGNVSFTHDSTSKTISGIMSVGGDLSFNVTFVSLSGGQIDVYGNVTVTKMSASGTTVISLKGTLDQLVSSTVNGNIPHLEINKPSGTAVFSGSLGIVRNMTYITGGTEFDSIAYGRSTVRFVGASTGGTINTGSMLLGDVTFSHDSSSKSLTGTLFMKGNLTVNTTFVWVNGGMIDVQGNVVITKTGGSPAAVGATQLTLSGSQNQSISQTAAIVFPGKTLTINKTGGSVELLTAISLSTSQHLNYTSTNTLNMNGLVLNGNGTFTCNSGTVNRGGALIWASGTTNNVGCTIN